jgi:hypothetical protein
MQVYEKYERRLCKQFRGLQEEVEKLHGRKYSVEEWANGCKEFNDAVVWHTNWAQQKAVILNHSECTEKLKQLLLGYK